MKAKPIVLSIFIAVLSFIVYAAGYKNGSEDGVVIDHILLGNVAVMSIEHCEKENVQENKNCSNALLDFHISHAAIIYAQSKGKISYLAKYILSEQFSLKESAANKVFSYYSKKNMNLDCTKSIAWSGGPACDEIKNTISKEIEVRAKSSP